MGKDNKIKLERTAVRLYSKPFSGRAVMAIQYDSEFDGQGYDPDSRPIYVGYDGELGQPLDEVLRENASFKAVVGDTNLFSRMADLRRDTDAQLNMLGVANERITALETKHGLAQRLLSAISRGGRSKNATPRK